MSVFAALRRIIIFVMGIVIMLVGLFTSNDTISLLLIGMVMVGIMPLDNVFGLFRRDRTGDLDYDDRHRRPATSTPDPQRRGGDTGRL